MAASKQDITYWVNSAKEDGYKYLVMVCDTYDWEDFPKAFMTAEETRAYVKHPGEMQKIMEVYDLSIDIDKQLAQHRAWNLPNE